MGQIDWRYAFAALLLITAESAGAATVALFDADLGPIPGNLQFAGTGGTQSFAADGIMLDSGASNSVKVGYTNWVPLPPLISPSIDLARSTGVTLDFELRIDFEDHGTNVDRSGFSVIVVTNDLQAIELEFWENEIWAQNDDFTHGEGAGHGTMGTPLTNYSLEISGSEYSLFAGGVSLFSGSLRDYSGFGAFPNVYAIPNFLFFGDN